MISARRASALGFSKTSPRGACLHLDDPLQLGTVLDLGYHKGYLKGSVSYCCFSEIGYWVGVRFEADMKWSANRFRPRHLLDLKKLLTGKPRPKQKPAQ